MTSIPPFAMPRPVPLNPSPCCNTGCDLKDRAVEAAEAFITAATPSNLGELAASLRAYREWRERK